MKNEWHTESSRGCVFCDSKININTIIFISAPFVTPLVYRAISPNICRDLVLWFPRSRSEATRLHWSCIDTMTRFLSPSSGEKGHTRILSVQLQIPLCIILHMPFSRRLQSKAMYSSACIHFHMGLFHNAVLCCITERDSRRGHRLHGAIFFQLPFFPLTCWCASLHKEDAIAIHSAAGGSTRQCTKRWTQQLATCIHHSRELFPLLQSPTAASFTSLHPTLSIARGDFSLGDFSLLAAARPWKPIPLSSRGTVLVLMLELSSECCDGGQT